MNRLCACGAIVATGQTCTSCRRRYDTKRRDTGFYDHRWHTGLRRQQLRREPRCEYTTSTGERCTARATDADHIVPRSQGGADALTNLQSLCHAHHAMKTNAEQRARREARASTGEQRPVLGGMARRMKR